MAKRYYWIKLKDSFLTSDTVDYFMSQPNGANYVVIYQMLCLKTINTGGRLELQIGEIIIPYDENKIQRDLKYFSINTIRVAMNLYKAFGMIYEDKDGVLVLADYDNLVGSETDKASIMRGLRASRNEQNGNNVTTMLPESGNETEKNVTVDIDIDIRDKDKEKDKEKEIRKPQKRFTAPTLEEVKAYCVERGNNVDAERFVDYYASKGWLVGKTPMKDWKAAVRTWEKNGFEQPKTQNSAALSTDEGDFIKAAMRKGIG